MPVVLPFFYMYKSPTQYLQKQETKENSVRGKLETKHSLEVREENLINCRFSSTYELAHRTVAITPTVDQEPPGGNPAVKDPINGKLTLRSSFTPQRN
jgi:hypothetical protein